MKQSTNTTAQLDRLRKAVKLAPANAQAHAELGIALQSAGDLKAAVASQRRALELDPRLVRLHPIMAPALLAIGQAEAAQVSYRHALALDPANPKLHHGLGQTLRTLGQFSAAADSYRQSLALRPDDVDALLGLGAAQHGLGEFEVAAAHFRSAATLAPDSVDSHLNLGNTLVAQGQFNQAAEVYTTLLQLRPDHYDAHFNLALCHEREGRPEAALASYRHALDARPGDLAAKRSIGSSLQRLGRHHDAVAWREQVLEQHADDVYSYNDLAQSLHQTDQIAAAVELLLRAAARFPDSAAIETQLASLDMSVGARDAALAHYRRAYLLEPLPSVLSNVLFALSHCSNDPHELFSAHLGFARNFEAPWLTSRQPHANEPDPARVIKVGFVSADLHNHAVATFLEPIFSLLAHSTELSLYVYSNGNVADDVTARFKSLIPHWRTIALVGDDGAERLIRQDQIDILIDLSGHSGGNRLPLFARKPAPVQASWIGYAGTTGLASMDYYISDGFHLPEGRYDDQFTEQIVRLPLSAPFMPAPGAPPVAPLPALSNGYLTFGTFNRADKLSRSVIAQWALLLRAIPDARLMVGGLRKGAEGNVMGWFEDEGIARERLLLQPRGTLLDYLTLHDQVDICLSPFPYTGSTTVCHALWMGVPTLTSTGPTNPSHSAVCYMAHLGLSSFVADDDDNFVRLGVFLSQNLAALAELRGSMRARFTASVVGHPEVAAAGLERSLRMMWERWCAGLPPQALRVRLSDLMTPEPEHKA